MRLRGDVRRVDEVVAAGELLRLLELLDQEADQGALRVPEDKAGADLVGDGEEVEFLAEPAVVAPLRLFQPVEVVVQLFLGRPGRAVDALQHRPALVAPPVGAGHGLEFERADLGRRVDVRSPAEIEKFALLVGRDLVVRRQLADDLDLVGVVCEDLERFVAGDDRADERLGRLAVRAHALLDGGEIVGRERPRELHVVVEAVLRSPGRSRTWRRGRFPARPRPSDARRSGACGRARTPGGRPARVRLPNPAQALPGWRLTSCCLSDD